MLTLVVNGGEKWSVSRSSRFTPGKWVIDTNWMRKNAQEDCMKACFTVNGVWKPTEFNWIMPEPKGVFLCNEKPSGLRL
jgi:hypothetical protein